MLKAVSLLGGEIPAVVDLKSLESLYQYTERGQNVRRYWGTVVPAQDFDAFVYDADADDEDDEEEGTERDDEGGARMRIEDKESDMRPASVRNAKAAARYEGSPGAEVDRLVRQYCHAHPAVGYEGAYRIVLAAHPALKHTYVAYQMENIPPGGDAPSEGWPGVDALRNSAGAMLTQRARARIVRENLDFETAFRLECQAEPELTKRYLGRT